MSEAPTWPNDVASPQVGDELTFVQTKRSWLDRLLGRPGKRTVRAWRVVSVTGYQLPGDPGGYPMSDPRYWGAVQDDA